MILHPEGGFLFLEGNVTRKLNLPWDKLMKRGKSRTKPRLNRGKAANGNPDSSSDGNSSMALFEKECR